MREELKPIAKQFFTINSDVKQIFVTEDKHCFYTEIEAKRFCKEVKKYEQFTPSDFVEKPKAETKKPKAKKEAPKKED